MTAKETESRQSCQAVKNRIISFPKSARCISIFHIEMIRLIQLRHAKHGRHVAVVEERQLAVLDGSDSIYALAQSAIAIKKTLTEIISAARRGETMDYDTIYRGESDWRLLPAFDHPEDPAHCLVTGTGLTHRASAENRQAMHAGEKKAATVTDSMRMYQWGIEGGRPATGVIGVSPEWFYKGDGAILRAHNEPLEVPDFGDDGGDEAEVAGVYVIDDEGQPRRVGMVLSNEFSDHVLEQKNYLYLAHSKLRTCAIGPELIIDADFKNNHGRTSIERAGEPIWSEQFFHGRDEHVAHASKISNIIISKYARPTVAQVTPTSTFSARMFSVLARGLPCGTAT